MSGVIANKKKKNARRDISRRGAEQRHLRAGELRVTCYGRVRNRSMGVVTVRVHVPKNAKLRTPSLKFLI